MGAVSAMLIPFLLFIALGVVIFSVVFARKNASKDGGTDVKPLHFTDDFKRFQFKNSSGETPLTTRIHGRRSWLGISINPILSRSLCFNA